MAQEFDKSRLIDPSKDRFAILGVIGAKGAVLKASEKAPLDYARARIEKEPTKDVLFLRNDGVELKSAHNNPWYVLMTIAGEASASMEWSQLLLVGKGNSRFWRGFWSVLEGEMNIENIQEFEFSDLSDEEIATMKDSFNSRCGITQRTPTVHEIPDFSENLFLDPVYISNWLFVANLNFSNCHFTSQLVGQNCRFNNTSIFSNSFFAEDVYLNDSTFINEVSFSNCTFSKRAFFTDCSFIGKSLFEAVLFIGHTKFKGGRFLDTATFAGCCFSSKVVFSDAHFDSEVDFKYSHFASAAHFKNSHLASTADFENCKFKDPVFFEEAYFSRTALFNEAVFEAKTRFKGAEFKAFVPSFHGAKLYSDTVFSARERKRHLWPPASNRPWWQPKPKETAEEKENPSLQAAENQRSNYAIIRSYMKGKDLVEEEQFFHRREIEAQQKDTSFGISALYSVFGFFSNYGHSVGRPAIALFASIYLFAVLYKFHIDPLNYNNGAELGSGRLGLSLSNSFAYLGLTRLYYEDILECAPNWLQLAAGMQAFLAVLFQFLLGLGIRSRFRLR